MKSKWFFEVAVIVSVAAHGVLLAFQAGDDEDLLEKIIKIPVMLEAEPPSPPPPPPPPPKEESEKKARPKKLAKRIKKVVEGDGLRTGEMVDAEVGDYNEEVEPEPEPKPEPPPPPPKPKPKPKVDKVKLAREFLSKLRAALMNKKKYPLSAQRMGVTGSVAVSFVVRSDSSFIKVNVKRSSGHDVLDRAAIGTVETLSGKLIRPKELGDTDLKTSVVLRYELNG